jgi:DNA-binding NarL/FixJ family response regulator
VPGEAGFERRTSLVDGLLAHWTIVAGTGSWFEAHLFARLGRALGWPNLRGCGISEQEVLQLVEADGGDRPLLLILSDSIAADRGGDLILRLRRQRPDVQILLLVQHDRGDWLEALRDGCALAIVHVESFGSGTTIQALQALRGGAPFLDPRLRKLLDQQAPCRLTGRERQTLEGLARGGSNRSIAAALSIAPATVRDYVSSLCRKLAAANRTEVVSKAIAMGLLKP